MRGGVGGGVRGRGERRRGAEGRGRGPEEGVVYVSFCLYEQKREEQVCLCSGERVSVLV